MKKLLFFLFLTCFALPQAQASDTSKAVPRIVLIPYQSMMYFSDADPDISRFSRLEEPRMRNEIRNQVELNIYHQLLSSFDVVSLMRASALEGEKDMNRIYAATRYITYSKADKEAHMKEKGKEEKGSVKSLLEKYSKKKEASFWVTDSAAMLGMIMDRNLFGHLYKKYNEDYILFITQFEINTDNKNTIEWTKQKYNREYTIHYNLFDKSGNIVRAEMLTIKAGGENDMKDITSKYLVVLGQRLREILVATDR